MASRDDYLQKLKQFWEVEDFEELKFNRVETLYGEERTEQNFDRLVDERVDWLLAGLRLAPQASIVEIGCGIGAVLQRIAARHPAAHLLGVDISDAMISVAREALGGTPNIALSVVDGDRLPGVPDQSVDLVICTGVFIHILDARVIRNYVSEAFRVLKPGGAFRFNGRYWYPERGFGATPGGRIAKWLARIGWYSPLRADGRKVSKADFNGLQFQLADVEELVYGADFLIENIQLSLENEATRKGYFRVNCVRPT